MTDLPIIRSSSLSGYPDCARRSAARMFRREIEAAGYQLRYTPLSVGAAIGSAVHAGVALTLAEKARTGTLAAISTIEDCTAETYRERASDGVLFDRESPAGDTAVRQAAGMAKSYQRTIAPTVEPIMVETRLEAETLFGLVLSGQADLVAHEPGAIRDLKTGKKRGSHKPQIGSYSLLARSHGMEINEAREDFVQRVSASNPQPDPVSCAHDVAAAETAAINILRMIADDLRTFREGDPEHGVLPGDSWAFAANPQSMLCSSKYCPAHSTAFCREHRQETE